MRRKKKSGSFFKMKGDNMIKNLEEKKENQGTENLHTVTVTNSMQAPGSTEGYLLVSGETFTGKIPFEEIDAFEKIKNISVFVGLKTKVVILNEGTHNSITHCSRARAQKILVPRIKEKLQAGEEMEGHIINLFSTGALLDIDGFVCFLRNDDFSCDFTDVRQIKKIGDKVTVRLKTITREGKYEMEMVEKQHTAPVVTSQTAAIGGVYKGRVEAIFPWGCFVRIGPDVTVLCDFRQKNLKVLNKVRVFIKRIKEKEDKKLFCGNVICIVR